MSVLVYASRWLLIAVGAATLIAPTTGWAQDSDGDGALDAADVFPCDNARAAVSFFPSETQSALLAFEDQWPNWSDQDFNDVVVRVNYRVEQDAQGRAVSVLATFDPVALGGLYSNGLALQLPIASPGVTARRRIAGGAWQDLTLTADSQATVVVSQNLRELFGDAQGILNSDPAAPSLTGQRVELEVNLGTPATLDVGLAPFDVFVFRAGDFSHQIHFPDYAGTAAMNPALFGTLHDGSTPTRHFVHNSGVPAALNLMTTDRYPHEGVDVSALFPDIVPFGTSGGQSHADFYVSTVVAASGNQVTAPAISAMPPADNSCVGGNGLVFECQPANWSQTTPGTFCTTTIDLPEEMAVVMSVNGHWNVSSGWALLEVLVDSEQPYPASNSPYLAGDGQHGYYTGGWHPVSMMRSRVLPAGQHTISLHFDRTGSASLNGASLQGFAVPTRAQGQEIVCSPSGWSHSGTKILCSTTVTLTQRSLVELHVNGHWNVTGTWGIVEILVDGEQPWSNSTSSYVNRDGIHGYRTNSWIPMSTSRALLLDAGTHTVRYAMTANGAFQVNGSSMRGVVVPVDAGAREETCVPGPWNWSGTGTLCSQNITVTQPSIVLSRVNGHFYTPNSGTCVTEILFTGEARNPDSTSPFLARQGIYGSNRATWQPLHTVRSTELQPGAHTLGYSADGPNCQINGSGMRSVVLPL